MGKINIVSCLVLLAMTAKDAVPSKDAMKNITAGFFKVLNDCRRELHFGDQIIVDLFNYWRLEYSLLNRDTGCLIICMVKKLNLLGATGRLHHGNAQEFAMSSGADIKVASKLVQVILDCEKVHERDDDECLRVLEVAKCFRTSVQDLNWNPDMEVVFKEVLAEI